MNFFGLFIVTFSLLLKSFKNPSSGKENVQFLDSPDFENFPDFQTGHDIFGNGIMPSQHKLG